MYFAVTAMVNHLIIAHRGVIDYITYTSIKKTTTIIVKSEVGMAMHKNKFIKFLSWIYLKIVLILPYYLANTPPFFANQHRLQV